MKRVIVALDYADLADALSMATRLRDEVAAFKVGLQLIHAEGPTAISAVADLGPPVFADVKLHDIPNTVYGAAKGIASAGARWLTVHAAGGADMVRRAVEGAGESGRTGVLAVSVLTSFSVDDLHGTGVAADSISSQVGLLAELASRSGAEGLVSSAHEAKVAGRFGLTSFVPGIRPEGVGQDDQKRVMSPAAAIDSGADYLVVGRAITRSQDPEEQLASINRSLDR